MVIVGIYRNNGKSTLYVNDDFASYYSNAESGRTCTGKVAKSVYVGDLDISALKVGSEIEIFYGEAISTRNGVFSPIRKIEVLK